MADQCIVCLEALDVPPPKLGDAGDDDPSLAAERHPEGTSTSNAILNDEPSNDTTQLQIAVIKACGHVLHDTCLKEWTEKANSCPICRTQFNLVEIHETTTGPIVSTYTVEDKKQVAEFDHEAWLLDQQAQEAADEVLCEICGSSEDEHYLMLCDNCNGAAHTYCVGLDAVPEGDWYCRECIELRLVRDNTAENRPPASFRERVAVRQQRRHRTLASIRNARIDARNQHAWAGAWNQISNQVHRILGLDLDFDGADELGQYRDAQTQRHEEHVQRERERIARQQGAGSAFANMSRSIARAPVVPREPPPETDAERRAWAYIERQREKEAEEEAARSSRPGSSSGRGSSGRNKRKASASPLLAPVDSDTPAEPERKLKRPRTRRNREPQNGASTSTSAANAAASAANGRILPQVSGSPPRSPSQMNSNRNTIENAEKPSFLSSLLTEVEQSSRGASDSDNGMGSTFDSNNTDQHFSANSPSSSNCSTPRALSLTPPLNRRGASAQMSLSSTIEPVYPPSEYSPNRASPPRISSSRPTSPSPGIRHPQPRSHNAHTALSSPASPSPLANLSPEEMMRRKEQIKSMVKKHLDPHYRRTDGTRITSEQYRLINQRVSRICYENLPPLDGMDEQQRQHWDSRIKREVEKGVQRFQREGRGGGREMVGGNAVAA